MVRLVGAHRHSQAPNTVCRHGLASLATGLRPPHPSGCRRHTVGIASLPDGAGILAMTPRTHEVDH